MKITAGIGVFFLLALFVWYFMPYANNPIQNANIKVLKTEINSREIKNSEGNNIELTPFRIYANACRMRLSIISYNDCLPIIVEGTSIEAAIQNTEKVIFSLKTVQLNESAKTLKGKYAVLIPGVRKDTYSGGGGPNSVRKDFRTDRSYIFKLGE